jgi:methylated-DNA-[protein]-cysteine S-methyltransferase
MTLYHSTCTTPFGDLSIAVNSTGAVVGTAFGDIAALRRRLQPCVLIADPLRPAAAHEQVRAYFAGERERFELPLAPIGTEFQQRVWSRLQQIPFGETRSYGQLAALLGRPSASRAVGRANATNPICLIIPCHRVVGSDGSLTGFAFGESLKRDLLAFEARRARTTAAA